MARRKKKAEQTETETPKDILARKSNQTFLHNRTKPDLHIVGAGGIGGNLIYHLFRDRHVLQEKLGTIYLYDGDTVEEKNLLRQNFLDKEVGLNKAEALAERYKNYLPIKAMPIFFDPGFKHGEIKNIDTISGNSIIICCVDNIRTRLDIMKELIEIYEALDVNDVPLFIDCGNETHHGNVIYCHNSDVLYKYNDYLISRKPAKSDAPYHKNCADYAPGEDGFIQIYQINNFASIYANIYLNNILVDKDAKWWSAYDKMNPDGHMFTAMSTSTLDVNTFANQIQQEIPVEQNNIG